nr:hypothetical protein [Alcanivorax sp.]
MCGIVGAIAQRNVTNILITGLKRLEYRGYDSAGVALLNDSGITRVRRQGKVAGLEAATTDEHASGFTGIAHTRWATHGKPSKPMPTRTCPAAIWPWCTTASSKTSRN